jgi:hypothetical protein
MESPYFGRRKLELPRVRLPMRLAALWLAGAGRLPVYLEDRLEERSQQVAASSQGCFQEPCIPGIQEPSTCPCALHFSMETVHFRLM